MLGHLDPQYKEATIIGGGVSGLMAAYYLLQKQYEVTLYEADASLGGMIGTEHTTFGLVENAAHSFRMNNALKKLCEDLSLPLAIPRTKKKYILRQGKMRRFPLDFFETAALLWRMTTKKPLAYPTMYNWALHHMGQAGLDNLVTPLMHGIYAVHPHQALQELVFPHLTVPLHSTFLSHLFKMQRNATKSVLAAPLQGMGALTDALGQFVSTHAKAKIFLNQSAGNLPDTPNVILCVPAYKASALLHTSFPVTAQALAKIDYVPMITATVFADRRRLSNPEGIGILCAANEKLNSLGVLFNSTTFENRVTHQNTISFTCMLGGLDKAHLLALPDNEIEAMIHKDLKALFGSDFVVNAIYLKKWPKALPVYNTALKQAWETANQDWCLKKGRLLFSNYTGQISLRGLCEQASNLGYET